MWLAGVRCGQGVLGRDERGSMLYDCVTSNCHKKRPEKTDSREFSSQGLAAACRLAFSQWSSNQNATVTNSFRITSLLAGQSVPHRTNPTTSTIQAADHPLLSLHRMHRLRCHTPTQICAPSCSFTPASRPVARLACTRRAAAAANHQHAAQAPRSRRSAVVVKAVGTGKHDVKACQGCMSLRGARLPGSRSLGSCSCAQAGVWLPSSSLPSTPSSRATRWWCS